jgi:hypothetical protein
MDGNPKETIIYIMEKNKLQKLQTNFSVRILILHHLLVRGGRKSTRINKYILSDENNEKVKN